MSTPTPPSQLPPQDGTTPVILPESEAILHRKRLLTSALAKHARKRQKKAAAAAACPDDEEKDPLKPYKHAGHWIGRAINPSLSLIDVFLVGMAYEAAEMEAEDTGAPVKVPDIDIVQNKSEGERELHRTVYKRVLEVIPQLDSTSATFVEDPKMFKDLVALTEAMKKQTRSDDIQTLKKCILDIVERVLLDSEQQHWKDNRRKFQHKSSRGFNDIIFGRLLCPHKCSEEYAKDPLEFCKKVKAAQSEAPVDALSFPAFAYDGPYDPAQTDQGLFRGLLLVLCYKAIFTSPSSVNDDDGDGGKTRSCNAELHQLTRVTCYTIAYVCMLARFICSSRSHWHDIDGTFNYYQFYYNIVALFQDTEDPWVIETLDWWDRQIFGKGPRREENSMLEAAANAKENSDMNRIMAQRKARKALAAAAELAKAAAEEQARAEAAAAGEKRTQDDGSDSSSSDDEDEDEREPEPEPVPAPVPKGKKKSSKPSKRH